MTLCISLYILALACALWEYPEKDDWDGSCNTIPRNQQSPIFINMDTNYNTTNLEIRYAYTPITNVNINANSVHYFGTMLNSLYGGIYVKGLLWNKSEELYYSLYNIHFHTPAEHYFLNQGQNIYGDLEMHIVHVLTNTTLNYTQQYLVIGVLFTRTGGNEQTFLSSLNIPTHKNINIDLTKFLQSMGSKSMGYYYNGSLTTPPCSKMVNWLVMRKVLHMSDPEFYGFYNFSAIEYLPNNRPPALFGDYEHLYLFSAKVSSADKILPLLALLLVVLIL